MPTFQQIINTVRNPQQGQAERIRLIQEIEVITGRRLLVYVADPRKRPSVLNLEDKTGFSDLIEDISADAIDVLINSPGGLVEVAESIVDMLRTNFQKIRFAVPNFAKSAATLLALSGDEILMNDKGELGPVGPQLLFTADTGQFQEDAEDILEGFRKAKETLMKDGPGAIPAYAPLLSKYSIGLLEGCENAIALSEHLAEKWLRCFMFCDNPDSEKAERIARFLSRWECTLSHGRAIKIDTCLDLGMKILDMRKDPYRDLGQKIWHLWCLYELHFERTPIYKIYENSQGLSLQKAMPTMPIQMPVLVQPGVPPMSPQPPQPPPQQT